MERLSLGADLTVVEQRKRLWTSTPSKKLGKILGTALAEVQRLTRALGNQDIAQYIKKEVRAILSRQSFRGWLVLMRLFQFDSRKGATWHCIVGRNFGSFVTHETRHFIYFYLGHCAILLFKTQ